MSLRKKSALRLMLKGRAHVIKTLLMSVFVLAFITFSAGAPAHDHAHFIGELVTRWDSDGAHMDLVKPFGYIDPRGVRWSVPAGARTDGASIPKPLWSFVGSPFTGEYRMAAVIHDYYCDVRVRPWQDVHRAFYEAMITSGVHVQRAKLLFAAVRAFGPRWDEQTIQNEILAQKHNGYLVPLRDPTRDPDFLEPSVGTDAEVLAVIKKKLEESDMSLEQVEGLADAARNGDLKPG